MGGVERHKGVPPDTELGRIAGTIVDFFESLEQEGVRMICMLDNEEQRLSMLGLSGYNDDMEAVTMMFMHLKAMFEANGKHLVIVPIGQG